MPNTKEPTLTELLNRFIPITNYRGCIVERVHNGFKVLGQTVRTQEEVNKVIDDVRYKKLKDSVVHYCDCSKE